jgi:hypothetical protein
MKMPGEALAFEVREALAEILLDPGLSAKVALQEVDRMLAMLSGACSDMGCIDCPHACTYAIGVTRQ